MSFHMFHVFSCYFRCFFMLISYILMLFSCLFAGAEFSPSQMQQLEEVISSVWSEHGDILGTAQNDAMTHNNIVSCCLLLSPIFLALVHTISFYFFNVLIH